MHYLTPVTVYYKLTASPSPKGSYLTVSQGMVGPNGQPPVGTSSYGFNGEPIPAVCDKAIQHPGSVAPCMTAHGYREYLTYQPASRFWAFQGIETGIFMVLAAVLIGITFLVLSRRDA